MKRTAMLALLVAVSLPLAADAPDPYGLLEGLTGGVQDPGAGLTAFPVLLISSGGRHAAMASTSAAMTGRPDFYDTNPAGTASLGHSTLSALHRSWLADSTIETLAFAADLGRIGVGVGVKVFHTPFTAYDDTGSRIATGRFVEAVSVLNVSYQFIRLPGLAASMGANLKYVYRGVSGALAAGQSAYGLPLDAGVLLQGRVLDFGRTGRRNLSVGIVIRSLGAPVAAFDAPLPTTAALGLSYSPAAFVTASGDLVVPLNLGDPRTPAESVYGSAAVTVEVARFLAVSGGVRIDASDPSVTLGTSLDLGAIALDVSYSLGAVGGFDPLESMSVGARIITGEARDE